ncbi:hypothetical protein PR048_001965 [Dryococelus australis]|uniref:Uncharacterized protein n=1 Tax=Dryococelus australis TaxID=614101 RepID=A0ABQ9IJ11_9NEOP|nr:hypothetical protein PR048_001965 [Dryococelus australis]
MQNAGVECLVSIFKDTELIYYQVTFVKDHGKPLVDSIKNLEGASYPTAHTLCRELNNLKEGFENVIRVIYFDATTKRLSKMSLATSVSVKLTLKKTVALSPTDPDKQHFDSIKVFDPKCILSEEVDPNTLSKLQHVKNMQTASTEKLLNGFRDLQNNLKKQVP